ncbi:hypothetical protein [Peribacillus sp. SCS-155]|uniref:hypothetical protein n=1 Tax=Peribacillus sedimenti TaxID=3115297 RepID=UPI003905E440
MDDIKLQERLDSLKQAYNNTPVQSDPHKILQAIKKDSRTKKRPIFSFPYVASFLLVGVISGMLIMFAFNKYETEKNRPADKPEMEETQKQPEQEKNYQIKNVEELRQYLQQRIQRSGEMLGLKEFEKTSLARDAEGIAAEQQKKTEKEGLKGDALLKDLELARIEIDKKLITPQELRDGLAEAFKKGEGAYNLQFSRYIDQLIAFLPELQDKSSAMTMFAGQNGLLSARTVEILNKGQKTGNAEFDTLAQGVVQSGYHFYFHPEGAIEIQISYQGLAEQEKERMSRDAEIFLNLKKDVRFMADGSLIISPELLGQSLIKYEMAIKSIRDGNIKKELLEDYRQRYTVFLRGIDNNSARDDAGNLAQDLKQRWKRLMDAYPKTETAQQVREEYERLQSMNFVIGDDFQHNKVIFPVFAQDGEEE